MGSGKNFLKTMSNPSKAKYYVKMRYSKRVKLKTFGPFFLNWTVEENVECPKSIKINTYLKIVNLQTNTGVSVVRIGTQYLIFKTRLRCCVCAEFESFALYVLRPFSIQSWITYRDTYTSVNTIKNCYKVKKKNPFVHVYLKFTMKKGSMKSDYECW